MEISNLWELHFSDLVEKYTFLGGIAHLNSRNVILELNPHLVILN